MKTIDIFSLHLRLDVVVKLLYLESFHTGVDTPFYKNLYLKHIQLATWFLEDDKKTPEDFLISFQKVFTSIQKNGFQKDHGVLIGNNKLPLTWAHRIACCLYLGIDIIYRKHGHESGISWGIDWFVKNNFTQEEISSILKKYHELSRDNFIILWPTCKAPTLPDETLRYKLSFENSFMTQECIFDIYSYEKFDNSDIGIQQKAQVIWEFQHLDIVFISRDIQKESLRERLLQYIQTSKFSPEEKKFFTFHSGDTTQENMYITDILFSHSYFSHLRKRPQKVGSNFKKLTKLLPTLYTRDMCIVGSGPLWVYNLMTVSDIDLIGPSPTWNAIQKLSNHIDMLDYQYYKKLSNKEIISKYFFYWRGYKFISLHILQKVKSKGLREKDLKQSKIIRDFLDSYAPLQENIFTKWRQKYIYYRTRILVSIIKIGTYTTKKLWIYKQVSYYWRKYILTRFR